MRWLIDTDPYPASEFDEWAPTYDASISEHANFPFDGYQRALDEVFARAQVEPGMSVLDLGAGTGNLALLFAQAGCQVWCSDYSVEMLDRARAKLPDAHCVQADLRSPWPAELDRHFDRIVSAYVFHHFPLTQKVDMLVEIARLRLLPDGRIIIADISFENSAKKDAIARKVGDNWTDEEYWLADAALSALSVAGLIAEYKQVSSCAGVYIIKSRAL